MPRRSLRDGSPPEALYSATHKDSIWNKFLIGSWLNKDKEPPSCEPAPRQPVPPQPVEQPSDSPSDPDAGADAAAAPQPGSLSREASWKVIPGEPRPLAATRQDSECRDNLIPHDLPDAGRPTAGPRRRRAVSAGRDATRLQSARLPLDRQSAPDTDSALRTVSFAPESAYDTSSRDVSITARIQDFVENTSPDPPPAQPAPPSLDEDLWSQSDTASEDPEEAALQAELQKKWILNLSMRFKDRSDREKFFITYAEQPNKWRRVTVSCDYRDAPEDSLEADLSELPYQREKNARIYESIRKSLPAIQFYDTVTNLKLETEGGRLHVHVTEDVNETIQYPPRAAVGHLRHLKVYKESEICFDSHLSGFVYKVTIGSNVFIKKEIPSPDTVEEFLYEINSLYRLRKCQDVIHFGGIIVDEENTVIKGLLIAYAEAGALVDIIYDERDYLSWPRRRKWAKQIIRGLSDIHEHGFVQGDFTLSNIVIDSEDNAKIIDINRRGCPLGWEPPEFDGLISSGQRISMYIGIKSDMFQLGMVLWGLGMENDEPEHHRKELRLDHFHTDIPEYFKMMILECLEEDPKDRTTASRLLAQHPELVEDELRSDGLVKPAALHGPIPVIDVDPATTVTLADIEASKHYLHPDHDKLNARNSPSTRYQYDSEHVTGQNRSSGFGGPTSSVSSPGSNHSDMDIKRDSELNRPSQDPHNSMYDQNHPLDGLGIEHNITREPETQNIHPTAPLSSHNALQEALMSNPIYASGPSDPEPFYPLSRHFSAEPDPLPESDHPFDQTSRPHDPSSLSSTTTAMHPRFTDETTTLRPPLHHDSGFDEPYSTSSPNEAAPPHTRQTFASKSPPTPEAFSLRHTQNEPYSTTAMKSTAHPNPGTAPDHNIANPSERKSVAAEAETPASVLIPPFPHDHAHEASQDAIDTPVELRGLGGGAWEPTPFREGG